MTSLAVAVATKGSWDPHQLLATLKAAGIDSSTEVHVACDPGQAPAEPLGGLSVHPRSSASLFELWGIAIENAKADWIAILHADALPAPGWFDAMQEATEREGWSDGYWGPVEAGFEPSDPRMIGYLTEYVQFHWPIAAGMSEIPGSNLVLPRHRLGGSQGDFSKTRLLGQGLAPKLVQGARVHYARPFDFASYCGRRFRHGRSYAAKRTPTLSLVQAIPLSLALPFVRTGRIIGHARRFRPLLDWLRWVPAIFLAETCWSAGELTGYITRRAGEESELD